MRVGVAEIVFVVLGVPVLEGVGETLNDLVLVTEGVGVRVDVGVDVFVAVFDGVGEHDPCCTIGGLVK